MEYCEHLKDLLNIIYNQCHCQHGMDIKEIIAVDNSLIKLYEKTDKYINLEKTIIALNESVLLLNRERLQAKSLLLDWQNSSVTVEDQLQVESKLRTETQKFLQR